MDQKKQLIVLSVLVVGLLVYLVFNFLLRPAGDSGVNSGLDPRSRRNSIDQEAQ